MSFIAMNAREKQAAAVAAEEAAVVSGAAAVAAEVVAEAEAFTKPVGVKTLRPLLAKNKVPGRT